MNILCVNFVSGERPHNRSSKENSLKFRLSACLRRHFENRVSHDTNSITTSVRSYTNKTVFEAINITYIQYFVIFES